MYKIAICDDEQNDLTVINDFVLKYMKSEQIYSKIQTYSSPHDLLDDMQNKDEVFDLLLLDIMMSHLNGIELSKELRQLGHKTDIIFITFNPDFAVEGYDVHPIHYLLKPINEEKFKDAMNVAIHKNLKKPSVLLNTNAGQQIVNLDDIMCIEVYQRVITVHTVDDKLLCKGTLSDAYKLLPGERFIRCHNSFVINLEHVRSIKRYEIKLSNNLMIPISKQKYANIQESFVKYDKKQPCV